MFPFLCTYEIRFYYLVRKEDFWKNIQLSAVSSWSNRAVTAWREGIPQGRERRKFPLALNG